MFPCHPCFGLKLAQRASLGFGASHGVQVIFRRCSVKCQVALSVLHCSAELHVSCLQHVQLTHPHIRHIS